MMNRSIPVLWLMVLIISIGGASCTADREESQTDQTDSVQTYLGDKLIVYQVFTRLFGNTKTSNVPYGTRDENGVGKFNDFTPTALKAIRDLGATHIWYTGVLEHATMTDYSQYGIELDDADVVKGRAGSPYAIKDYYDVNPDLAENVPNRLAEFDALIKRTHDQGLKVLIDFVPNHVARSYYSDAKPEGVKDLGEEDDQSKTFDTNNNFYYLPGRQFKVPEGYDPLGPDHTGPKKDGLFEESPAKTSGNDVFSEAPSVDDWFETVKLNYGIDFQTDKKEHFEPIPDTWIKMRDILLYWAERGVDGFRCDMAEMVPPAFWQWAITAVKDQYPNVHFIAEIYQPPLYRPYLDAGFDYLYDKVGTYDAMRQLITGEPYASEVWQVVKDLQDIDPKLLRFLENHDEQRLASPQFAGDPWKGWPGMVVSATIGKGPVMVYFGQEVGEPGAGAEGFQGDDGRTTIFDYWGVPEHQKWMNGGQFDGGALSEDQRKLRTAYQTLLITIRGNPAFAKGDRIQLTDKVEATTNTERFIPFLISHETNYLVLASFSDMPVEASIDLSEFFRGMAFEDVLGSGLKATTGNSGLLEITLKPHQAVVLKGTPVAD